MMWRKFKECFPSPTRSIRQRWRVHLSASFLRWMLFRLLKIVLPTSAAIVAWMDVWHQWCDDAVIVGFGCSRMSSGGLRCYWSPVCRFLTYFSECLGTTGLSSHVVPKRGVDSWTTSAKELERLNRIRLFLRDLSKCSRYRWSRNYTFPPYPLPVVSFHQASLLDILDADMISCSFFVCRKTLPLVVDDCRKRSWAALVRLDEFHWECVYVLSIAATDRRSSTWKSTWLPSHVDCRHHALSENPTRRR